MVGGGGRSRQRGHAEPGVRAQEGRREGWGRLGARGIGLGGQEREKGRGAVVRVVTASPWWFQRPSSLSVQGMTTRGGVQQLRESQGRGRAGARRGRGTRPAASAFGVDGVTGKTEKEME